jgi:hypothetical protein
MTFAAIVALGLFLVLAFVTRLYGTGDSASEIWVPRHFGLTLRTSNGFIPLPAEWSS